MIIVTKCLSGVFKYRTVSSKSTDDAEKPAFGKFLNAVFLMCFHKDRFRKM